MKIACWPAFLIAALIAASFPRALLAATAQSTAATQPATAPSRDATDPTAPQFLGHDPDAKSICYICDGSGSLIGDKDDALRNDLARAVARLLPTQSFNLFFFQESDGGKAFTSLDTALCKATPDNIHRSLELVLYKLTFRGATNPIPALEEAWRENPETIYLLTDGEFDDPDTATVMAKIKELNEARKNKDQPLVKVNTVLLVKTRSESYPDFEAQMKKIADDTGGTYTKAAADDLN